MSKNLKHLLGLSEPKTLNGASGVQAKAFKTAFGAVMQEISRSLRFTAAHAPLEQHRELADRRDKAISAYQAVARKIDPNNPAASDAAIHRVCSSASGLRGGAEALQDHAARYHAAWIENEEQLDIAAGQVSEMVEWGYSRSDKLAEVVTAIRNQSKLRKYKEAVEALTKFLEKLQPAYDDYVVQRDAKIAFDQTIADNHELLDRFGSSDHELLSDWRAEIQGNLDGIEMAVEVLDYATALADLDAELPVIEEFLQEYAYEAALSALQPKLDRLDANLVWSSAATTVNDLRAEMDRAAESGDLVLALLKLQALEPEVDAQLQAMGKVDYETAAAAHAATFTAADGTADEGLDPLVKANDSYQAVKKDLEALVAAEDWAAALAKLPAAVDAGQALLDLRASYDHFKAEEARLAPHFESLDGDYLSNLSGNPSPGPDWAEDVKLYRAYMSEPEQGRYEEATKALQALAPRIATLESRVNASDVEATAKADAAANRIRALVGVASLAGLSTGEWNTLTAGLRKLPFSKRTQLLEDLHGPSAALTNEQWLMQQAIYEATELDKSFKKKDDQIRQQYLDELKSNQEVQNALAHWNDTDSTGAPVMDREAKERILKQIVATQSKAYDVDEPEINWSPTQMTSAAEFLADSRQILIDPSSLGDPEEMVRAVLHENTHNVQDKLKAKYLNGEIDKRDPMYEQAKMFALNYSADGYVTQAEHNEVYRLQPTEMHAHDAGDKGAMAVIFGI
jgi:hypothetical protein